MSGTYLTSVFWHHLVWNPQKVLAFGGECNPIVIGPNSDILGRIRIVFYPIHWQHSDTVRLGLGKLLFTKALSCSQFHHPFQQLIMKLKVLLNATSNSKSVRPESSVWRWIHEPIPFNGEKELTFGAHLGPAPYQVSAQKSGQVIHTELPQLPKPQGISYSLDS